jgi:CheY-like chemotaxis protein
VAIKTLIVDDDPLNIELLDALLNPEGYSIIKAGSGEAALKCIEAQDPELVLLDIMMSGLSGYRILDEIRKNRKTRQSQSF